VDYLEEIVAAPPGIVDPLQELMPDRGITSGNEHSGLPVNRLDEVAKNLSDGAMNGRAPILARTVGNLPQARRIWPVVPTTATRASGLPPLPKKPLSNVSVASKPFQTAPKAA
jgi:hypothetical protein